VVTSVNDFVERYITGEDMTSSEDLQFYENNSELIEAKLRDYALQESSTSSEVPLTNERGEIITEGGEGVGKRIKGEKVTEEVISEEVTRLRELEQKELAEAIPNIEQYKVDGKVVESLITDAKDLKKYNKIYEKYNEPITEAIREAKEKVTVKVEDIQLPELNEENLDIAIESATDIADLNKKAKRVTSKAAKNSISKKIKESEAELASLPIEGKIAKGISDNFDAIKKELKDKGLIETKGC